MMSQPTADFGYSFKWFVGPVLSTCAVGAAVAVAAAILLWLPLVLMCLLPLGYGVYQYLDWKNTRYTITGDFVIKRSGIFFEHRDEIPIAAILKRRYLLLIPGADVGSIMLETAAQSTNNSRAIEGDLILANVERLSEIYELIGQLMQLQKVARGAQP